MIEQATPYEALLAAINRVGSQPKFGKLIGVSQPTIWRWVQSGKRLPPQHVLKVEAETGVSRHDLRPDIYPRVDAVVSNDDFASIALLPEGVASNDAAALSARKRA